MGGGSKRDNFKENGPGHLKHVDWSNHDHRRTVAASLVKGVYALERDRQKKRKGGKALAPPWWGWFHFQKIKELIDENDESIYGAIYELEYQHQKIIGAPRFVMAFRGTLLKKKTRVEDLKLDFKIFFQRFHESKRCQSATKEAEKIAFSERRHPISTKLWLAGHSLGAALAIHVGKHMAEKDAVLETYLFNPPFPSILNELFSHEKVKQFFRNCHSILAGIMATTLKDLEQHYKDEESFTKLSKWLPYLYVNRHDSFCSKYIAYFKQRNKMAEIGAGSIGIRATMNSCKALLMNEVFGGNGRYNAFYFLPSAHLFIKNDASSGSHEIRQWWRVDSQLDYKRNVFSQTLLLGEGEASTSQQKTSRY